MRTTITFDDDTAAAVNRLRQEAARGVSEIVNDLIRAGLRHREERPPFVQQTSDLGIRVDVSNVAEALDLLDGPDHR
jgi:metal-responsive CopG/Arc/MetJ family transcriptional regulator